LRTTVYDAICHGRGQPRQMDNIVGVRDFFWTDAASGRVNKRGHRRKAPVPGH